MDIIICKYLKKGGIYIKAFDKNPILNWEVIGVFFIIGVGSLLHFTFEWSGNFSLVGIFSAVNESVWEHLKLGYWSLVFFSIVEYIFIRNRVNNFFLGKALGILAMQLFIVIFFYGYNAILGHEILFLDIGSYIIGAIICQSISYKIFLYKNLGSTIKILSIIFLIFHGVILIIFTFYPPKLPIFKDSNSNSYGRTYHNQENH